MKTSESPAGEEQIYLEKGGADRPLEKTVPNCQVLYSQRLLKDLSANQINNLRPLSLYLT